MTNRGVRWTLVTLTALPLLAVPVVLYAADEVGICAHDGRTGFLDAAADLGLGWVRLDGNWFQLEPAEDDYRFDNLDTAVQQAADRGLKVYLTLAYTPEWVPRRPGSVAGSHNDVPVGDTQWRDFVATAVAHYRALGVTHFGIWNEPNLEGFFEGDAATYVSQILIPGAEALRGACTDCKVLGPDLANVGDCDVYLDQVMAAAPAGTFDIVAHHIYNGFQEMGTQLWDGDRFHEALEQQRFAWTRRSLRQILDAHGYTGEVWITESGYRATPGDAGEEARQAQYLQLVLDYQLARPWWTNTFFYESMDCRPDQPTCDIDGFGLMRGESGAPGQRGFPEDFRLKPAFQAVKDYLGAHPEIGVSDPLAPCSDGIDNDGDGLTDGMDPGCTTPDDPDETGDPAPRPLTVYRSVAVTLDGELSELGSGGELSLGASDWRGTGSPGGSDLSATLRVRWLPDRLVFGLEVVDDQQVNDQPADSLWAGDSLQLAFDVGGNGGAPYDGIDDHELTFGLNATGAVAHRGTGPAGAPDAFQVVIERVGTVTTYEIEVEASALPGVLLAAGAELSFSFLVNEDDGLGREGWLEFTPGIGSGKVPGTFGRLSLVGEVRGGGGSDGGSLPGDAGVAVDAGASDAGDALDAGGSPADGGIPGDAGGAGLDGGAQTTTPPVPGCDCSSGSEDPGALGALLLLLGYAMRRRPS